VVAVSFYAHVTWPLGAFHTHYTQKVGHKLSFLVSSPGNKIMANLP